MQDKLFLFNYSFFWFIAKHCWTMFPGPTISQFGSHEMLVVFSSDSFGTANGFNAFYEIRDSFKEDIPSKGKTERRKKYKKFN